MSSSTAKKARNKPAALPAKPTAKKPAAKKLAPIDRRPAPTGWGAVTSLVVAEQHVYAGSGAGQGAVCAWNANGSLVWTTELPAKHDELAIDIDVSPSTIFAYARESRTAWILDRTSGAIVSRHDIEPQFGAWIRNVRMSPDGSRVIVRGGTEAHLFALPGFQHVAPLPQYCNEQAIAFSHDSKYAAVNGHEIHIWDLTADPVTCTATFEPDDSPYRMSFAPSGRLVSVDGRSGVRIFERDGTQVAALDACPERKSKPELKLLAVADTRIAVARRDGHVIVFDHEKEVVRLGKLDPRSLACSADGSQLWVGTNDVAMYSIAS